MYKMRGNYFQRHTVKPLSFPRQAKWKQSCTLDQAGWLLVVFVFLASDASTHYHHRIEYHVLLLPTPTTTFLRSWDLVEKWEGLLALTRVRYWWSWGNNDVITGVHVHLRGLACSKRKLERGKGKDGGDAFT